MSLEDIQARDERFMAQRARGYEYDEHDGDHRPELDRNVLLTVAVAARDLLDRTDWTSMLPGEIDNLKEALDAL